MRSTISLSLCALTSLTLSHAAIAVILEGRRPAHSEAIHVAKVTTYPTVPSFSAPAFTYGAFSQVYPSGYTLPSAPLITTAASRSAIPTSQGSHGFGSTLDTEQVYLSTMCAPQGTHHPKGVLDWAQRFPCNRVSNSSNTCICENCASIHHLGNAKYEIYLDNATFDELEEHFIRDIPLYQVDAQAQKECLCPGGKGERVWEDLEGCAQLTPCLGVQMSLTQFEAAPNVYACMVESQFMHRIQALSTFCPRLM